MDLCELCNAKDSSIKCPHCCNASYCSQEHQEMHKDVHEKCCYPHVVKHSSTLGRYLATSREIKAGELLHRESPTAVGPQPGSMPLCLGCLCKVGPAPTETGFNHCPVCHIAPFCQPKCTNNVWHTTLECASLASLNSKHGTIKETVLPSQTILPLRCYLLQWVNPKHWEALMKLESHLDARKGTSICRSVDEGVTYILFTLGLISMEDDREVFQKICGILDVNSFEVRGPEGDPLRAVYPTAALLAHDCLPSACIAHDPSGLALIIRAANGIKCGDIITHNYAGTLIPTIERRESLRKGKYFECTCKRCKDPSELGTHLSSLRCSACSGGPVMSIDPLDQNSNWKCEQCGHEISGTLAAVTHTVARTLLLKSNQGDAEEMETLLLEMKSNFYNGHAVLLEIGQLLAGLYNEYSVQWAISSRPIYPLRRRWELCKGLSDTLSRLDPGISRIRGLCMHEMAVVALDLARKSTEVKQYDKKSVMQILLKSEELFKRSIANLLYEPDGSPERNLVFSAFKSLKKVKTLMTSINEDA